MTPIRTGYSPFDRLGWNGSTSRDLSLYIEDKNGNRIKVGSPAPSPNKPVLADPSAQNTNLSGAIDDLMRDIFGLQPSTKPNNSTGDMKLDYTAPDGTKIKLDIDRPDAPKAEAHNADCSNDMSQSMDASVDEMMKDMGLDTEDAKQSAFEKDMEANLKKSMQNSYADSMDDAVTKMMKDMGFDTEASQQSDFEQDMEEYFTDSIESAMQDSYMNSILDNVFNSMIGNDSYDDQEFSPWSPWGNTLFSPYNSYLSAATFPASYAYSQMLGEWMLANQRSVYNPNQVFQGNYKF